MTIERFNNLPFETKKNLMLHWWHYYGKAIYSLKELEDFCELLDTNFEQVLNFAIFCYSQNQGPTILLQLIMQNKVEETFQKVEDILKTMDQELKNTHEELKKAFITEIVSTSGLIFEEEPTLK